MSYLVKQQAAAINRKEKCGEFAGKALNQFGDSFVYLSCMTEDRL